MEPGSDQEAEAWPMTAPPSRISTATASWVPGEALARRTMTVGSSRTAT